MEYLLECIQDGSVEYGEKDCELIGEIILEVLDHRKRLLNVMEQKMREGMTRANETMRRELERALYEGSGPAGGQWREDYNQDALWLYAPDGSRLWSISGLARMQMGEKEWNRLKPQIERQQLERWVRECRERK